MKGHAIAYTPDEMIWIEAHATLPMADLHAAFITAFGRADVTQANLVALRKRKGWRTGRSGQFHAGHKSWNTGANGLRFAGSEKGWFRPGERRGRAVKLYQKIGTERLSKNGYVERKIHDGMPLQSRWRAVHLIEWETANGPIPQGMALKCLDGDKANTSSANWQLIPRALLPRLAGGNGRRKNIVAYDAAPQELKPSLLAVAELEYAARQRRDDRKAR